MNIYERIKQMSIDEMAEHHALFARACIDGAVLALGLKLSGYPPLDVSIKNQKQWLESEAE